MRRNRPGKERAHRKGRKVGEGRRMGRRAWGLWGVGCDREVVVGRRGRVAGVLRNLVVGNLPFLIYSIQRVSENLGRGLIFEYSSSSLFSVGKRGLVVL